MVRRASNVTTTLLTLAIVATGTQLTSCASILSDNSYDVAINSSPANASFTITDHEGKEVSSGTTPAVVHLNTSSGFLRRAQYLVSLQHEGYGDVQKVLRPMLDWTYFGNLLLYPAGLLGAGIIDPLTGAMYTLPPTLDAQLPPVSPSAQGVEPMLYDTALSLPQLPTMDVSR